MPQEINASEKHDVVMIIHQMSDVEKRQEIARLREKALHDEASALKGARMEGMEIGEKEGRAAERARIISKMKAVGMTEEEINNVLS